jgi:hypothetical protein
LGNFLFSLGNFLTKTSGHPGNKPERLPMASPFSVALYVRVMLDACKKVRKSLNLSTNNFYSPEQILIEKKYF